jgi:hypothetical protein
LEYRLAYFFGETQMQARTQQDNHDSAAVEQIAKARGLSRMIMKFMLEEKLYAQAAELVSGMESVFAMLGRDLDEVITDKKRWPERISFATHLQPKIEKAHAEIAYDCRWSMDILSQLPDTTETLAIRRSFKQIAIARNQLFNKLSNIQEQYLLAQQRT